MGVIVTDSSCLGCGYNLRGLEWGSRCPECGASTSMLPKPSEKFSVDELDRELEEREASTARNRRLDELIATWEIRGRRMDELLGRLEALLSRPRDSE